MFCCCVVLFCFVHVGRACPYAANDGNQLFLTSGQRITPGGCDTPFVWKPYLNSNIPITYTDWYPGEPDCYSSATVEDCLHLWSPRDFKWHDFSCAASGCAICQIDMQWYTTLLLGISLLLFIQEKHVYDKHNRITQPTRSANKQTINLFKNDVAVIPKEVSYSYNINNIEHC